MFDMVSNTTLETHVASISPEDLRKRRDRALALAYVEKGQTKAAVRQIVDETEVPMRTVYRAIKRQLPWALAQKKAPATPSTDSPGH